MPEAHSKSVFTGHTVVPVLFAAAMAVFVGLQIGHSNWLFTAGVIYGLLLLLWPVEVALGGYAILTPFDSVSVIGNSTSGTTLTWLLGAIAGIVLLMSGLVRQRLQLPSAAALRWGAFIAWGATSILWGVDRQLVLNRLPTAISLFFLYLIAVCVRVSEQELSRVAMMTVIGGCLASAYVCSSIITGGLAGRMTLDVGDRAADPNQFAASLLLPLALAAAGFLSSETNLRRLLSLAFTALICLGVLATMSRGAVLAMAAMIVVFLCKSRANRRIVIAVLVLGSVIALMPGVFFSRFEQASSTGGAGRVDIWEVGLASLPRYGLLGAGLENFEPAYQSYAGAAKHFRGYSRGAHNIYLGTAVELGLCGLLLMFLAIKTQLRATRKIPNMLGKLPPRVVACVAAAWGLLVAGFFLDILWRKSFWLTWILLTLAVQAQCNRAEEHACGS